MVRGLSLWCGASRSVALRSRRADHDIIADWRERFQREVTAALDDPFLGPFHQDRSDQAADRGLGGEEANESALNITLGV